MKQLCIEESCEAENIFVGLNLSRRSILQGFTFMVKF